VSVSKTDIDRRTEAFVRLCRRKGMKVTHQRMEIFGELAGSREHPDAESVFLRVQKRVPTISRDTVYRTLATLESEGLIRRAEILGGPARFDPNTDQHHHFICTVCGMIRDFHSEALDQLPIPNSVRKIGDIEYFQVQVRGVCSDCTGSKDQRR
jgi:Fur family transcriptional regulator, peroxide stress response regulator